MTGATIWTLVAVIVGGGISIGGQVILELVKEGRKAQQLSHAIAGEISALLEIVEARQYVPGIQAVHTMALAGQVSLFQAHIEQTYFSVIEANLQNIGILRGELPLLIPRFLILSKSALEDIQAIRAGDWNNKTAADLAILYDGLHQVMTEAMSTGREIVTLIEAIYPDPRGRYPLRLSRWWWFALIFVVAGAVIDAAAWFGRS